MVVRLFFILSLLLLCCLSVCCVCGVLCAVSPQQIIGSAALVLLEMKKKLFCHNLFSTRNLPTRIKAYWMTSKRQKKERSDEWFRPSRDFIVQRHASNFEDILRMAISKGCRKFSFFGTNPDIISTSSSPESSAPFSDEEEVRRVLEFANFHSFTSLGFIDCGLNWRGLDVLGTYTEVT